MRWTGTGASCVTMKIERGARGPAVKKWCWESAGRNSLVADKRDAHKAACGVRLEFEHHANLVGSQIIGHSSLDIECRTSNV